MKRERSHNTLELQQKTQSSQDRAFHTRYELTRFLHFSVIMIFSLLAAGCGSGGGSSNETETTPTPPVSACGALQTDESCISISLSGFGERHFVLYEPPTRQDLAPIAIFLHGDPGNPRTVANFFDSRTFVADQGYLGIRPLGQISFAWTSRVAATAELSQDSQFINAIIDKLVSDNLADPDRVFVSGFSAGGFMVYQLACEIPERIKAAVAVSGQFRGDVNACNATSPLNIHHIHGTADTDVPDSGRSDNIASVTDTLQLWVDFNGCDGSTSDSEAFPLTQDQKSAISRLYNGCQQSLVYTRVLNGVHEEVYQFSELHRLMKETFEP